MKKVSLLLAAFALVLGVSQCTKQRPEMPSYSGPAGDRIIQHVDMSASYGGGNNSKLEIGVGETADLLKLTWTGENDLIKVYQIIEGEEKPATTDDAGLQMTKLSENKLTAEFEGDIAAIPNVDLIFRSGTKPASYENQGGTLDYIKDHLLYVEGTHEYVESGNYDVSMSLPYAVLKLDLNYFAPSSKNDEVTVKISKKAEAESKEESVIASVKCAPEALSSVYVAIPVSEKAAESKDPAEKTYIFSGNGKTVYIKFKIGYGAFYTADNGTGGDVVIAPKFSVGLKDSKPVTVEFAPGNLYWDGSAFKFEENQWDTQPTANGTWNESHVSHFKWSDAANAVTTDNNYSGDLFCASNFTVTGDSHTDWRTLSSAEWEYLLGTTNPSRTNATSLRAWKDLGDGVKGLVILPDGTDVSVMSSITSTSDLASHGAVFLPAAGYREGTNVKRVGSYGFYWSGTPSESDYAYIIYFGSNDAYMMTPDYRYTGDAVRLVR